MSLSDDAMAKLDEVMTKKIQYCIMKIEDLEEPIPIVDIELTGAKGASYEKFVSDITKSKDCRFGAFSYMVNKKSHPVIFYWTPHEADSLTVLTYTNTNTALKKTNFKGLAEIHASNVDQLNEDFVTSKLQDFY